MVSKQVMMLAIAAVLLLPTATQAAQYLVGDDKGWTNYFDYNTWAKGKVFYVGDTLVFKYPAGAHNVYKVNGSDFEACTVPLQGGQPLVSGYDVITLSSPGSKWYICGVGNHCGTGQKLFITVQALAQPPSVWSAPKPAWKAQPPVEHMVGDDKGWTINFDYNTWAKDKVFRVGDKLVFKYPTGNHNVYKVNGSDFMVCRVPSAQESLPLTSGYDVITLATPGRKWYICGVGHHCGTGQKLFITVQDPMLTPAPVPSPSASAWDASKPAWKAPVASPVQYMVGDEHGWTNNFDYNTWAKDKVFRVGDALVFKYLMGNHNVYKVNGSDFNSCTVPSAQESPPFTSGSDVITLTTPGRKWYICGVGQHCRTGQKLFITVLDPSAAPAPSLAAIPRKVVAWPPAPTPSPFADHYY